MGVKLELFVLSVHPVYATPWRKYYELRQWKWPD